MIARQTMSALILHYFDDISARDARFIAALATEKDLSINDLKRKTNQELVPVVRRIADRMRKECIYRDNAKFEQETQYACEDLLNRFESAGA